VPFALPALIWNMMMSMSGGWFFVVASESISVGQTSVALPGIGSYIALAIARRDLHAIGWAVLTMLLVIAAYDQLVFRPLVAWADRFRVEQEEGSLPPASWALKMYQRSRFIATVQSLARTFVRWTSRRVLAPAGALVAPVAARAPAVGGDRLWLSLVIVMVALGVWHIARVLIVNTTPAEALLVIGLGCLTLLRVLVLIALASVIWVPVGVWIGMRPRATAIVQPVAQFLAAFPANLLFPMVVYFVVTWKLHPDIWLSPLMILGTQWYILFNVIAGAASIPGELRHVAQNFRVRGWLWWRRIALPAVMPFYVTGAITASGGSWNAAIVAEVARWGDTQVTAHGIGAYIAEATVAGDFHRVVLGIAVMSLFVLLINRLFWRPLYYRAERRFRLS
jgi:NitT/TauT family transport system permease protein